MKTQKRLFTVLAVFCVIFTQSLFAADGLLSGEKDLRVVQTKWFDIIYPQRSEKTAALLFQTADIIYEEVTAQYGMSPSVRYPVVITPATDQLNAFFTVAYYNRIVLFDTSSSEMDELSGSFSQGFLSVFRHELTHAVSYNMKNKFWQIVGKIFGDPANIGYIFLSSGMAEGASVTSESAAGQGRLNNEFFRHRVKQAKIENLFPSYFDMQGASDTYPSGAFYDFNAAFHQWLQEKYGMEKYANFWYTLINFQRIGVASSFKRAYGIKLKDAWKNFQAEYQVPQIPANPVEANIVSDFFKPEAVTYSERNRYGARYSDLTSSKKGLAWIEYSSSSVFYLPAEKYNQSEKAKKLLTYKGLDHIMLSPDGNYLALSYYSSGRLNPSAGVKIYDMKTGRLFETGVQGLKNAALLQSDGNYYLVASRYESPYNYIETYQVILKDNSSGIKMIKKLSSVQQELFVFPASFTPCDEGHFAYIQNKDLRFSICISDLNGNLLARYEFPEGVNSTQISYAPEENAVYFNWAHSGTMVRPGRLSLENGTFEFSSLDISGGLFYPVAMQDELIYVGKFFRQNRLLRLSLSRAFSENHFTEKEVEDEKVTKTEFAHTALFEMELDSQLKLDSKKYNPFKYLSRGLFLPFSSCVSEAFGVNAGVSAAAYALPYGFTYITNNPWSYSSEGIFQFSAGWGDYTNSFGTKLSAVGGSTTGLVNYQTDASVEFDKGGWKQSLGNLVFVSALPLGRISYIKLENSTSGKIGRQNQVQQSIDYFSDTIDLDALTNFYVGMYAPVDDTLYYNISDSLTLYYTHLTSAGPGRHETLGFASGVGLVYAKDGSLGENAVIYQDYLALAAVMRIYLPHLLPFESEYGYTYNLPFKMEFALFPSSSNYGYATSSAQSFGIPVFDANFESVLFGMNIQKALPFFTPIFVHDFYVTAGYTGACSAYLAGQSGFQPLYLKNYLAGLKDGSSLYQDAIYLKFALELNPNIGLTANSSFKFNLAGSIKYSLHQLSEANPLGLVLEFGGTF